MQKYDDNIFIIIFIVALGVVIISSLADLTMTCFSIDLLTK